MESAILKELLVFFFEMRCLVRKIIPYFPIMFITYASCTMGTMFMLLPADEQVDESLVPILVFKDRPIAYHAFLVSIMISLTGAFSALLIQHKPRVERFCRCHGFHDISFINTLVRHNLLGFQVSSTFSRT